MIIAIKALERHSYLKKAYYNNKGILNRNENILAKEIDTLMPRFRVRIYASQKLIESIVQKAAITLKYHPLLQNSTIGALLKW